MRLIDADEIRYDNLLKTGNKEHPLEWAVSRSRIDNMPTILKVHPKDGHWVHGKEVSRDYIGDVCASIHFTMGCRF